MKRTPLYQNHVDLGARMVEFGGWEMPVMYTGILEEHQAVRRNVGVFDICHMGEIRVTGKQALDLLQYATPNDVSKLAMGQAQYSFLLDESGGMKDDCVVYRFPDHYYVVVNASPAQSDYEWLKELSKKFPGATVANESEETGKLDIQGPRVLEYLQPLTNTNLDSIGWYYAEYGRVAGVDCLISRTGYTGEDGFELFCAWDKTPEVWNAIMERKVVPCGLGARDTLRLECSLPLSGSDMDLTTTPHEGGFGWVVKLDKGDFVGRDALVRLKDQPRKKLINFEMVGRGIPRHGMEIAKDGKVVGVVTSGAYGPTVQKNIGMGHVPPELAAAGNKIDIMIREKPVEAVIVPKPFYRGSAKSPKRKLTPPA